MRVRLFRVILALLLIGVLCVLYGWQVEPRRLVVRDVAVPIERPIEAEPIRIAFISDIHAGGRGVDAERVGRVVEAIQAGAPDLILIAGDLVNGHDHHDERPDEDIRRLGEAIAPLSALDAPLGVFAVAGNHDNWFGDADQLYAQLGIAYLDDTASVVEDRVCVVGFGDEYTDTPDPDTLLNCPPHLPIIGLMHNPDTAFRLPVGADLLLAGHTHGGQVNLPLLGRVVTFTHAGKPYAYGLAKVNGVPIFVTAGVGMSVLPVRFRAPPEVVFLTLG